MHRRAPSLLLMASAAVACASGDDGTAHGASFVPDSPDGSTTQIAVDGGAGDAGIDAATAPIPLPPSGIAMGATVFEGGTEFRVWAPHATKVAVSGDFANGASFPLTKENNGLFAAKVADAHAGQHYRFTLTNADQTLVRTDPRARAMDTVGGDATIIDPRTYAWKTPAFATPSMSEAVLYEMHVPSFNVPAGASSGTFRSATEKLDHLQSLGINLIELMPSSQFRGTVSWGYNPTAFFAPQSPFGTPDDLRHFVDEAHARGIGVILDVVYNHTDRQHQGLWCFDGDCPNNGNGIYFFTDPTYAMTPWGPRPDYAKKEVTDFLIDGLYSWLAEYRMDGFRWDSTNNIRAIDGQGSVPGGREFMAHANDVLHGLFPRALFIAEDYKGYAPVTAPTSSGGVGFDAQWDGFFGTIDPLVAQASDAARSMGSVRNVISYRYNNDAPHRIIYTENHDIAGNGGTRLPKTIDGQNPTSLRARKGSMLAAASVILSPGIPMLLQGQEIFQTASWTNDFTPPVRWEDASTYAPVLAFYRDLLRLRRNLDGTSKGLLGDNVNVFHVNEAAKVVAWQRSGGTPGDNVVILANYSGTAFTAYGIGLPQPGVWRVRFNSDSKKYSTDFADTPSSDVTAAAIGKDGLAASGAIALSPYGILVLSR